MEKEKRKNTIKEYFNNFKNVKSNFKKVKSSPYASLSLALKARKLIIGGLIIWIGWMGYGMVKNYQGQGVMLLVGRIIMISVLGYVCYSLYKTIPQAQKQLDYYKKYPHLINYAPTDTKQTINEIMNNIKLNQEKEVKNARIQKEEDNTGSAANNSANTAKKN